jgi:hypothetical protein
MRGSAFEVVLYSLMVNGYVFTRLVPGLLSLILSVIRTMFAEITALQRQIQDLFDAKDGS